jgi:hypothetical protein
MAHLYNPSYLGGWDGEDPSSRPSQTNSSQDPVSKITRVKMDWRCGSSGIGLLCKCEAPSPTKKKKNFENSNSFNYKNNFKNQLKRTSINTHGIKTTLDTCIFWSFFSFFWRGWYWDLNSELLKLESSPWNSFLKASNYWGVTENQNRRII